MKTNCCEKCGKELGFFSRKNSINNDRMNIHYDTLCNDCYKIIKGGIDQIDLMYQRVMAALKEDYKVDNMASVDIDTLIYLAVEAVMTVEPAYSQETSNIYQAVINRTTRSANPMDDMARIVDRLIDYGFAINKKNAQIVDFLGYFARTTVYLEQMGFNSNDNVPRSYSCAFYCCRGIIAEHMETHEIISIPVPANQEIDYAMVRDANTFGIRLNNLAYPSDENKCIEMFPRDERQLKTIIHTLDQFNEVACRRKERRKRDTMTIIIRNVMHDLARVQPNVSTEDVPLDCILLCLVKDMMSDPEGCRTELYDSNGMAMDLLFDHFEPNLKVLGLANREDTIDFLRKNTLLAEGFNIRYEEMQENAWGFFTTKGYILCFKDSRKFVYIFEDAFPNDIYYPCNDLIYKGCRFLQLAEERPGQEASGDYRTFDGMIFFSEDIDLIGKMNRFFNLNNIFYIMDKYIEVETQVYRNRDSLMEVKRVSDRLFGDFSYLPFCQYDEWASIREKMKEDDFLLCQLIDEKTGGRERHPVGSTVYTIRIMDAFNRGARELNRSLDFGDVSIAKGILWGYFNESLVDTLSREWIRIAGDIVRDGDSLEDAFSKYFNMADIESDKSYYLGLFIYYLMSKNVLPADDFLENYERCVPVYKQFNKKVLDESTPDIAFEPSETDEPVEEAQDVEPVEEVEMVEEEKDDRQIIPDEDEQYEDVPQINDDELDIKDPAEILAEKAEAEARIEKPIRRVIDENGQAQNGEE